MMPKISSTFAILDVKRGRVALSKHFRDRPRSGVCPKELLIPVVITGFIEAQWGRDDGESIEFSVDVERVQIWEPET